MILQNFLLAFPLFFLVGLGFFSAKVNLIDFNVGKGLAKFAFNIAIPCLLFQTIRGASNLPAPDWNIGLGYFGSCTLVFLFTFLIGRKSFHLRGDESTVFGMSAQQCPARNPACYFSARRKLRSVHLVYRFAECLFTLGSRHCGRGAFPKP